VLIGVRTEEGELQCGCPHNLVLTLNTSIINNFGICINDKFSCMLGR